MTAAPDQMELTAERTATKRVGIYVRVSAQQQVDRESLSVQDSRMHAFAEGKGWQVAKVFTDAGFSAKNTRRPALQQMLRRAKRGKLDVVLVSKVDRISRNLSDLLRLIEDLRRWNVDFVCAPQSFDTSTPMGKLTLNVLGSFAQFERDVTAERVRENMRERARDGKWSGGVVPFGYRASPETKRLEPEPEEAKVVRRIFEEYRRRGTVRGTVHALNAARVFGRSGKPWALSTIRRILSSPTYIGRMCYAKRRNTSFGLVAEDEHDWIAVEGAHEPIVDKDLFAEVQTMLEDRGAGTSWTESSPHLLSGLGRCAECGSRMVGITQSDTRKVPPRSYSYYRCVGHIQKGASFCPGVSYRAAELEDAVLLQVTGMKAEALRGELERAKQRARSESGAVHKRLAGLKKAFGEHGRRERRLIELYEEDAIDMDLYKRRRRQLERERLALATEICELESRLPDGGIGNLDINQVVARFKSLQETFGELSTREKQRLLRAMIREVVLYADGRVEIDLNLLGGLDVPGVQAGRWHEVEVKPPSRSPGRGRCSSG